MSEIIYLVVRELPGNGMSLGPVFASSVDAQQHIDEKKSQGFDGVFRKYAFEVTT